MTKTLTTEEIASLLEKQQEYSEYNAYNHLIAALKQIKHLADTESQPLDTVMCDISDIAAYVLNGGAIC